MGAISSVSHVILCSATSGVDGDVTYDGSGTYQYIKAKSPKINIKFNSKNSHRGYHKSRLNPDVKYMQSYNSGDALFQAKDVNSITEWILDAYIAKTKIYLLVDFSTDGGTTWVKKSWYTDLNAKVYYLKGILKNLDISQKEGHVWNISFKFEESWSGL